MFHIKNLNLYLDNKQILNDISFDVDCGEILTIIGPSGCGKSSILKSIAGIHKTPDTTMLVDGKNIGQLPIEARETTLVFQDFVLFPHMTIQQNMMVANTDKKLHKFLLDQLNIYEHYHKYPHQLSGGEQQRIALARAIAYKPKLLLLDEPFSNIDAITTKELRKTVLNLLKKYNITTIMVTHDVDDVWYMGDKVLIVNGGKVVGFDTALNLYTNPPNRFVAEKMGEVVQFRDNLYRPENIQIIPDNSGEITGIITEVRKLGMYNSITVAVENKVITLIDFSKELLPDQEISLFFNQKIQGVKK